ncbi:kinase-like domain-containing protein [Gymnopilus junonius]|uniref:Kinase-like domain-containing protein n=1 Tax=Gymnopilus junonius TaxID=109634 RepID=A0A9P5NQM8_GYMJU|nr:kinase-like domain-containing protein [Gymnopilus junonius]
MAMYNTSQTAILLHTTPHPSPSSAHRPNAYQCRRDTQCLHRRQPSRRWQLADQLYAFLHSPQGLGRWLIREGWLCDWHGTLPPNTPLSPMQCGAGAGVRPDWIGKRLVAVKLMKKRWEGGWDECQKNKELESLRAIPFHPNVIPLYDFFLLPDTKELYFVFESMEGNLYHLIKARKGRPFAGGLVSSIFRQIVLGLDHIHSNGYFHRDMKPENVLVTTTGLFDYTSVSPLAPPNAPKEKDVVVIIKLADFGLARETRSAPPYTEYVSTRWYRAPEVLLLSRDYSNPVDMWAFGTIMVELVNLRPLFPGCDQGDQVARICEVLGDPSDLYGVDRYGSQIGGGPWHRGHRLAQDIGFQFPKIIPKDFYSLFDDSIPRSLINCIRDLLRYDPDKRLTSRQCLEHVYLQETIPRDYITVPTGPQSTSSSSIPTMSSYINGSHSNPSLPTPSHIPPHSQQFPDASISHRIPYTIPPPQPQFPPQPVVAHNGYQHHPHGTWPDPQPDYPMSSPQDAPQPHRHYTNEHAVDTQDSLMAQDPPPPPDPPRDSSHAHVLQGNKLGKLGATLKKQGRWALFGGDKAHHNALPPVDEISPALVFPRRKRTKSSSTDSRSLRETSPALEPVLNPREEKKIQEKNKKEAQRLLRDAEIARRTLAQKNQQEQARAVMNKRKEEFKATGEVPEWPRGPDRSGPLRRGQASGGATSTTIGAASGRFAVHNEPMRAADEWGGPTDRAKARRREFDDDHSMSSSDLHSLSRVSSISFATVDSDPGPSRLRSQRSLYNISRMTSRSSLRTSFDDFPPSARSSNSFSLEGQLVHDFRTQASVSSHLSGSLSPPPLQLLSLSPTMSPSLSPSPPWIQVPHHGKEDLLSQTQSPPYLSISPRFHPAKPPHSPMDMNGQLPPLPPSPYGHHPSSPYAYPPSTGHTPKSAKSAINPIFKVVSYKWDSADGLVPDVYPTQPPLPPPPLPTTLGDDQLSSMNILPPFSELEAVAGGDFPPLSPMVFSTPEDD